MCANPHYEGAGDEQCGRQLIMDNVVGAQHVFEQALDTFRIPCPAAPRESLSRRVRLQVIPLAGH
jgi:hypothetical protein